MGESRMEKVVRCEVCGEPLPEHESMFKYHGFSGPCPRPPLSKQPTVEEVTMIAQAKRVAELEAILERMRAWDTTDTVGNMLFELGVKGT